MNERMTPAQARRRLPGIAKKIEQVEQRRADLYALRLEAFEVLADSGDRHVDIAARASALCTIETTPGVVATALHKARTASSLNGD